MAKTREKVKGRKESGPFIMLHKSMIGRNEFYTLAPYTLKLLIDLYSQYNGYNNGDLCMAWSMMEKRGWKSRDTLNRARKDLLGSGFIIVSRMGGRNLATLYAVTFDPINECKGKIDIKATTTAPNYWKKECPKNGLN